ncbi:MAG: type II methionyl aminopeptidase, partial [Candidatus Thorarchaeota archaeon]
GGKPAFPCNVCINEFAAHYSSPIDDKRKIPDSGLVKVDIGVHVNGYIADTAMTIDLDGALDGFIAATDDALEEAIEMIRPGVKLGDVGRKIERIIKAYGLKPIKDLTGHQLKRYRLHGGKKVPNVKRRSEKTVEVGEYYAVEPYASQSGSIMKSDFVYIFANTGITKSLEGVNEKLRLHLRERYGPLPFASRWIRTNTKLDIAEALKDLMQAKIIRAYPVLIEKKKRMVSQSEHTIFVNENGSVVLTAPD